jgi:hypothetical protein
LDHVFNLLLQLVDLANSLADGGNRSDEVLVPRQLLIDRRQNSSKAGDLFDGLVVHVRVMLDSGHPLIDVPGHFFDLCRVVRRVKHGPLRLCGRRTDEARC